MRRKRSSFSRPEIGRMIRSFWVKALSFTQGVPARPGVSGPPSPRREWARWSWHASAYRSSHRSGPAIGGRGQRVVLPDLSSGGQSLFVPPGRPSPALGRTGSVAGGAPAMPFGVPTGPQGRRTDVVAGEGSVTAAPLRVEDDGPDDQGEEGSENHQKREHHDFLLRASTVPPYSAIIGARRGRAEDFAIRRARA